MMNLKCKPFKAASETAVRMIRMLRTPGAAVTAWEPPTFDRR